MLALATCVLRGSPGGLAPQDEDRWRPPPSSVGAHLPYPEVRGQRASKDASTWFSASPPTASRPDCLAAAATPVAPAPSTASLYLRTCTQPGGLMKSPFAARLVGLCLAASAAHAEEGLWTFDNLPAEKVRQAYGFAPDAAWLDHVRLASVRLPGCSARHRQPARPGAHQPSLRARLHPGPVGAGAGSQHDGGPSQAAARSAPSRSFPGCSSAPPVPIRSSWRRSGQQRKAGFPRARSSMSAPATTPSAAIPDRR